MPTILANATIKVRWFQDSGERKTTKVEYDSQNYRVRFSEYPKKQVLPDPTSQGGGPGVYAEIVAVNAEVLMMDKPKHTIRHDTTLIDCNGRTYRIVEAKGFTEFGLSYYKLYLVEYKGAFPR